MFVVHLHLDMNVTDKKLDRWKEAIPRMNEEDLEFILDFPECFDPPILKMVKSRMKELSRHQDDEEEDDEYVEITLDTLVCMTLNDIGCQYEYDEDGDIAFDFHDERFTILIDEKGKPFIQILKTNWLSVRLEDYNEVAKLYQTINRINNNGQITATYTIDKAEGFIYVHFLTTVLFTDDIPALGSYLQAILTSFFDVRRELDRQMEALSEEKSKNSNSYVN